jgi:hypothetical protein
MLKREFLIIGDFIWSIINGKCTANPSQKRQGDFNYRSQRVVMQNEAVVIPGFTDWSLDLSLVFSA